jgi:hypothetical protein
MAESFEHIQKHIRHCTDKSMRVAELSKDEVLSNCTQILFFMNHVAPRHVVSLSKAISQKKGLMKLCETFEDEHERRENEYKKSHALFVIQQAEVQRKQKDLDRVQHNHCNAMKALCVAEQRALRFGAPYDQYAKGNVGDCKKDIHVITQEFVKEKKYADEATVAFNEIHSITTLNRNLKNGYRYLANIAAQQQKIEQEKRQRKLQAKLSRGCLKTWQHFGYARQRRKPPVPWKSASISGETSGEISGETSGETSGEISGETSGETSEQIISRRVNRGRSFSQAFDGDRVVRQLSSRRKRLCQ